MIELIQVHEPTEQQLVEWLRGNEITYRQYHQSMKTNYNNRMVTDYEKESTEKPKFPENTLIRESSFPSEKPSVIRRILARVKNICK